MVLADTSLQAPAVSRLFTLQHTHFLSVRMSLYAPNGDCLRVGAGFGGGWGGGGSAGDFLLWEMNQLKADWTCGRGRVCV